MKGLIKGALNRPVTVVVLIIALAVFSITGLSSISLKLMPDMSIPVMVVYTVYPGAAPEEVDELVTDKISSACESLSGLKTCTTQASENLGLVAMQFDYGTDMDDAYNDVKAAVDAIRNDLPDDIMDPTIMEIDTSAIPDMTLSVAGTSDDVDVLQEVDDVLEPALRKVSTVADVTTSGGEQKYISIELIPEYAAQYGQNVTTVAQAIGAANFSMPVGTAEYGDQSVNLSAEVEYKRIPELEQVPLTTPTGQVIHLSDIARVHYATEEKTSVSRYNGQDNVSVTIQRKQSASSVTMSREVNKVLNEIRAENPDLEINVIFDMSERIIETLTSVGKTVLEAVLLAMLILFIFFGDLKGSLIVGSSMPISIMATLVCMWLAGFALNVMTLGAIMVAVGMMTDNAVVVLEMCFRKREDGLSFKDAAYEGTRIVMNSVVASTITTVVVYVPLSLMKGLSGQMFKQLGFTIIFALLSSLICAITIIPLCFTSYRPVEKQEIPMTRFLRFVAKGYRRVLRFALKWKKTVFLLSIVMLVVTVGLTRFLRTELYSSQDEGIVALDVQFRPNLNLEAMDATVRELEDMIRNESDIERYSVTVTKSSSSASISAYTADDSARTTQEIVDDWNQRLKGYSTMCEITASAGSTMGMSSMSSANSKEFDLVSSDLSRLKAAAAELEDLLQETNGVLQTDSSVKDTGSKARVVIDPVLARARGFTAQQIAGMVYVNMSGSDALDVTFDGKTYTVTVEYPKGYYETVSDVESMTFMSPTGASVPLSEVGEVRFVSAPQTIVRKDGLYQASVTATMTSETKDVVTDVLEEKANAMVLGPDVSFTDDIQTSMMEEEFTAIGQAIFIAIFLVFMVMAIQFESIAESLLIMMCIPFAGIGSILLLLIMGCKISMISLMGVLMLSGIVVNNGIILIDMGKQNQAAGMETAEALVEAGSGRMRPILMTTLTTILAMVPTAMGWSKNSESMQGMAVVIVGGLIASTVLTLLLLPTFYLLLDRFRAKVAAFQAKSRARAEARVLEQEEREKQRRRRKEAAENNAEDAAEGGRPSEDMTEDGEPGENGYQTEDMAEDDEPAEETMRDVGPAEGMTEDGEPGENGYQTEDMAEDGEPAGETEDRRKP